ncbi:MAG: cytochrome c-type biosis protein CcmH [Solirubrobacteraceae bacterium]|nr:cytochrome c-type biosis protein CcmH [Solirubrobacteraceae bacterium]
MTKLPPAALLAVIALALPASAGAAQARTTLPDVEDEVMCVVCGTALNVSTAPSADRERAFIRRRIAEGKTKDQIKSELVAQYGPRVLATPNGNGFDVTAWLVPALFALLALGGVTVAARRWRRGGDERPVADGPELSPADARRLDADLGEFDR